jgi:general secretion pathway protein G
MSRTHRNAPRRRRGARSGFTLLEVIVAVTIVALLATMIVPKLLANIGSAKQKLAKSNVKSLSNQVKLYLTDNSMTAPDADFELGVLLTGAKPYLEKKADLIDPWGNPYVLLVPGTENADFDIVSYGSDGQQGGEGEAADVSSAEN